MTPGQPPPQLDPVSAAVALLAVLFAPPLPEIIGHYAVIIVAAVIGGAWSLGRHQAQGRAAAAIFLLLVSGTAAMLTMGIARLIAQWLPGTDGGVTWLVAPVALLIGGIGHEWPAVGRWLLGRLGRRIDARIGGGGNGGGGGTT